MSRSNGSTGTGDMDIKATFQALVDTIIPPTLRQAEAIGAIPVAGAVQLVLATRTADKLVEKYF